MMKAAIFNDTSPDRHYGCDAVMSTLSRRMAAQNIETALYWPVSKDWMRNINEIEALDFQAIVVNGEGTIHHTETRRKARALLELGEYSRKTGRKSFLINASLFALSDLDFELLRAFDAIFTRESTSQELLCRQGIKSHFCPDLSMAAISPKPSGVRRDTLYTDSVASNISQRIQEIAEAKKAKYVPLQESESRIRRLTTRGLRKIRRIVGLPSSSPLRSRYKARTDYAALFSIIQEAEFVVTGRFHAATICLATKTPFIAIESNTPKIQFLLRDALGNTERCLHSLDEFNQAEESGFKHLRSFSPHEKQRLDNYLQNLPGYVERMFNHIEAELQNYKI